MSATVLVADDDQEFRSALVEVIERADSLELVATASDAAEAIELALLHRPRVALVDVRMGEGGGERVARELAERLPDTRVLALSAYDDHGTIAGMLEAGAKGYVLKGTSARGLVEAIERTAGGDTILSPGLESAWLPQRAADASSRPIRVIIADDDPEFVYALSGILEREPRFELVGRARDAASAARLAALYRPDIALLDWAMPGGGASAAADIAHGSPDTRVVALSGPKERHDVVKMLKAGASGYVVKSVAADDLVDAVLTAAAGHAALSPDVASAVVEELVVELAAANGTAASHAEKAAVIRSCIDEARLTTVYQPIVDVSAPRVLGVEALTRFDVEPARTPDVWFSDAVAVGLGSELDTAAAANAMKVVPELPPGADLFVNALPESLFSPGFREVLEGAPPERVVVELTEHAPVQDYARLQAVVAELRESGFRIAVDDVGAGYASFRHLLALRPDVLKMDISLCRFIESDRARQVVARGLAALGREIGASVIAEGIESMAELETVRSLGVTSVQGYLLGRPTPRPLDEMLARAGRGPFSANLGEAA